MNIRKLQALLFAMTAVASLVAKKDKDSVLDSINQKVSRLIQLSRTTPASTPTYDYIIVGLGTAGATLARLLSDNFDNSVLVLEAGSNHSTDPDILSTSIATHRRDILTWSPKFAFSVNIIDDHNFGPNAGSAAGVAQGGGFEEFSMGRGWGGSSMHNFMTAVRGTPDVYNQWAAISGDSRWLYDNLVPYMKYLETYTPFIPATLDSAQRGTSGPLLITQDAVQTNTAVLQYLDTMAHQMGCSNCDYVSTGTDFNLSAQLLGLYCSQKFNTNESNPALRTRTYAVTAFLPASVVSSNGVGVGGRQLLIQSNALVDKVLFTGATASGVQYIQNGVSKQANARKTIILCAGAPFSSAILQRSGIGDPATLSAAGVQSFIANTNVGQNFKTHYGIMAAFARPSYLPTTPAVASTTGFGDGSVQATTSSVTGPNGPTGAFAAGVTGLTAGQRNFRAFENFGVITQEVQWACNPPLSPANYPRGYVSWVGWNLRPKSSGTSQIVSADPTVYPLIDFALYTDTGAQGSGTDMEVSGAMLNTINNMAAENGLSLIYPSTGTLQFPITNASLFPINSSKNAATIRSMLLNPTAVTNHYVGTCNMGTSIANGVVDGRLNVFGTTPESLKVADNSIAPLPETGNTAYQAYTIGLVCANILGQFTPS